MLDSNEVRALSWQNLLQSIRLQAKWAGPRAEWFDGPRLLMTCGACRLPLGTFNGAARLDAALPADEFVDRASRWFVQRKRGFSIYLNDEWDADVEQECADRHFLALDDLGLFSIRPSDCSFSRSASGLEFELVRNDHGVQRFASVACESYGEVQALREQIAGTFLDSNLLLSPSLTLILAREAEEPVGAGLLLRSGRVGGIYWVGTVPQARARGVASAVTQKLLETAGALGLERVVLQAAPGVEKLYQRIGFEPMGRVRRFTWPFTHR